MNWIDTPESSTIVRFAFDSDNHVLTVEFKHGATYNYFDVPEVVFEAMKSASSRGRYLVQSVKGTYRYARA